jgi:hypothetical protein
VSFGTARADVWSPRSKLQRQTSAGRISPGRKRTTARNLREDPTVPTFELRNRLRIAHEHSAASLRRTAQLHEEAAEFWEQVHQGDRAAEHRTAAAQYFERARHHDEQAQIFAKPREP